MDQDLLQVFGASKTSNRCVAEVYRPASLFFNDQLANIPSIHRFQEVNQRLDRIENSLAALTSAITALTKGSLGNQKNHSGSCSCNSSGPNSTTEGTPKSRTADEFPSPGEATQSVPSVIASYIQLKGRSFLKSRDIVNAPVPEQPLYMGSSSIASMTNDAEILAHEKFGMKELAIRGGRPRPDKDGQAKEDGPLDRLGIISKKVAGLIPHYSHRVLRDDATHFERSIPSREEAIELVNSELVSHFWKGFLMLWQSISKRQPDGIQSSMSRPSVKTLRGCTMSRRKR